MKARVRRSALLALIVAIALITSGCWRVGNLDGPGTGSLEGRTGNSVNVDKSVVVVPVGVYQVPVITYADPISHRLRVGVDRLGTGWHFDDLDGPGTGIVNGRTGNDVGTFNSAALGLGATGPGRSIDVYYFDSSSSRLRHGHFNGHPDDLYLAVSQKQETRLRHTWFAGTSHFEDVDGIGGVCKGHTDDNVGYYTAAQPDGLRLQAFYYDATAHTLRHASWDGTTWTCETLDGPGGVTGSVADDVGQYTSMTITPDRHLHVFYLDATTHRLRHGRFDGSTWTFETIDGTGALTIGRTTDQVGHFNAIAYGGTPVELQMWTGDGTTGDLRAGCSFGPGIAPPAACS